MSIKKTLFGLASALTLSACNGDGTSSTSPYVVISHVPDAVLSAFFVSDWTPFEAAANALRTINPLYTVQQFSWWQNSSPPLYDSYSIANGRVEYAHAAGLTGAGQIISIVDAGFLTSHIEFNGKTIHLPGGANNPGVDDHGTGVASIAAGVASGGQIIGVAPGANIALGSFNDNSTRTAANNQAIALGAIVQNNSWGFEIDATSGNFQSLFAGSSGTAYYNSIVNLTQNAVVVFAASNDQTRTTADIMAALPLFAPAIQNNWISVVNAVPTFSGSTITSGTIISSSCLEAAAWCMAADGSVYAATASGNSAYDHSFGSSFAAPQVSGAIALLAEAFPTLTATQLRARLLASADNQFYTHTGYVEFAPGVQHGFSNQFGHGFLNMQAALSPIGGSYLPRSSGGSVAVNSPTILSTGLVGSTLSSRLANHNLVVVDGLGTGFDLPASVLTAQASAVHSPVGSVADLITVNYRQNAADAFTPVSAFSQYASGQEMAFQAGDTRVAMLMPDQQSNNFGLSVSRAFDLGQGSFRLGLNAMHEGDGFAGVSSVLPGEGISGTHAAATWEWGVDLAKNRQIALSGSFGVARSRGALSDMELSNVAYNDFNVSYSLKDTWASGDRISFGIGLPQAVGSGQAQVTLPVSHSAGTTTFSNVGVALAPDVRQLDISVGYGVPLSSRSDMLFRAVHRLNDGHVASRANSEAAIAFRVQF